MRNPVSEGHGFRLAPRPLPTEEDIDAVYLWVDGSDAEFLDQLDASLGMHAGPRPVGCASANRFRDNGELRYSLRSLAAFAPWVRTVHIVTNGQVPPWLDISHERISIITHGEIFPDAAHLPTFNSNAIELHLHRVPNLSRRFLYLNDDVFFGRPSEREDFLTPFGTQYVFLQPTPLPAPGQGTLVHDRAYGHTQHAIERLWARRRERLLPAHVPQLYDRDVLALLAELLSDEFRKTSAHRFRSPDDLVMRIAYFAWLLESEHEGGRPSARILSEGSRDYFFMRLEGRLLGELRDFCRIRTRKPKFFCINDDVAEGRNLEKASLVLLRLFLRACFPRPCVFERRP